MDVDVDADVNADYSNFTFNTKTTIEMNRLPPSIKEGEVRYMDNGEDNIIKVRVLSILVDEEIEKYKI